MEKKRNFNDNFYIEKKFFKTLITRITIPLIFILIIFFTILSIYSLKQKQQIISDSKNSITKISSYFEEELNQILISSNMMTLSDDFFDVFFTYYPTPPANTYKNTQSVSALSNLRMSKSYIDTTFFMKKNQSLVIASNGTISTDLYFSNEKYATKYNNKSYWYNIKLDDKTLRFLPEEITISTTTNYLQPILIQRLGNYKCIYPFVINIDKKKFSKTLDVFKPTNNALIYIYNSDLNEIMFCSSHFNDEKDIVSNILQNRNKKTINEVIINGAKYTYLTAQPSNIYSSDIIYITLIPNSDIESILRSYQILGILTLVICGILAFLASFFNTYKLYQPVQELIELLPPDFSSDEFTFLKNKINEILNDNADLKSDINFVFPSICEKYMLDILQNKSRNYDQLRIMLEKYNFAFHYKYFTCALVGFTFTKRFTEEFSPAEQVKIQNQFNEMVKYFIKGNYECYMFQIEESKFCVIANSDNANMHNTLYESIQNFQKILNFDNDYIIMYAGIGQTYNKLENMHLSWKEARGTYYNLTPYSNIFIRLYEEDKVISNFTISFEEDNYIFNYLLNGDYNSITKTLATISNRMNINILEEANIKKIYSQLYYIGNKVLANKGISESELLGSTYINFSTQVNLLPPDQIYSYLCLFYQAICELRTKDKKISLSELKEYIDNHYYEDIYLENIAEKFHTSAKYMSHLLKEALNMPYKRYLNYIRICKAKELLANSNSNIERIAEKTGFNNRTSFIRAFKAIEGVTPSEYRDSVKNNN